MKNRIEFANPSPGDITSPYELFLMGHTIIWPSLSRYVVETESILGSKQFIEEKVYSLQPGNVYVLWLTDDFEALNTPKVIDVRHEIIPSTHHERFRLTFSDPNEKTHYPVLVRVPVELL